MEAFENFSDLIEDIFVEDKIEPVKLKEFLKLISVQLNKKSSLNCELQVKQNEENKVNYLADLITKCEQRLENLTETPKTKIVIRNEGQKLQSIIESIDCLKHTNRNLQAQINENSSALNKLKKLECDKMRNFQGTVNCFQNNSMISEICDLKRKYFNVQHQVDELVVTSVILKEEVEKIQIKIIHMNRIPVFEEKITKLLDWRASLREDLELMSERYEHVKMIKVSKCEVQNLIENKVDYNHLQRYVPKRNFDSTKGEFIKEFQELKELFCELQLCLTAKLVDLHKDVQKLFLKLASKNRIEKRSLK